MMKKIMTRIVMSVSLIGGMYAVTAVADDSGAWTSPASPAATPATTSAPAPFVTNPTDVAPTVPVSAAGESANPLVFTFTPDYPNAVSVTTPKKNSIQVVITNPKAITGKRIGVITYGTQHCEWVTGSAMINTSGDCNNITTGIQTGTNQSTIYTFSVAK